MGATYSANGVEEVEGQLKGIWHHYPKLRTKYNTVRYDSACISFITVVGQIFKIHFPAPNEISQESPASYYDLLRFGLEDLADGAVGPAAAHDEEDDGE